MSSPSSHHAGSFPEDHQEKGTASLAHSTLSWSELGYEVPRTRKTILSGVSGSISSGEVLAVMGPSGAGKSTFLDALCRRQPASGQVLFDGCSDFSPRDVFSFVEQDDALIGVLTVRETVTFAARLALPANSPDIADHVDATLRSLGLQDVANNIIGTALQRGISGGQKRRVTIACSVVARPRVLVCDEPTSGLDSASSREVVASLKRLALETNTIVILTIHQPPFEVISMVNKLLILARGQVMYNASPNDLDSYLTSLGHPTPTHANPVDNAIDLVSTEFFSQEGISATDHLEKMRQSWLSSPAAAAAGRPRTEGVDSDCHQSARIGFLRSVLQTTRQTLILSDRNLKNYMRNLLQFGIRAGMYIGMGVMLAIVWMNLGTSSTKIQDRLSVHFFSVAFLGFMSVSGIPAFLEERAVFIRERTNGLYTPTAYLLANTITSIPFLFVCTVLYSVIIYWAIGLQDGATHFFKFLVYLYLGIFAAESLALLMASILPIFVAALAMTAFANGLAMCVQGFFIASKSLPRWIYYSIHWVDYQTFAFELLVKNDLAGLTFQCPAEPSCLCPMPSSLLPAQCALSGNDILQNLGYAGISEGLYAGILVIIIVVMRLMMLGALVWRKR